jgi:Fe2+ or Zn2+ uptake regulation protein
MQNLEIGIGMLALQDLEIPGKLYYTGRYCDYLQKGIVTTMNNLDPSIAGLRAQGFRLTPQRLGILNILHQSGEHLTPTEIYQKAQKALPGLTEATVYRTLNFLTEQELVLAAHIGSGQLVYQIAEHDHDHLICRACGRTEEIDHAALEILYAQFEASTGYRINSVHQTFFGLCPDCQVN